MSLLSKTVDKKRAARRYSVLCRICGAGIACRWWEAPVCRTPCQ